MINHVNILTENLARSLEFYRSMFSARVIYELRPTKVVCLIDQFEFFIEEVESVSYDQRFHLGFKTDKNNIDQLYKKALELNLPLVKGNNPSEDIHQYDDHRTAFYLSDPSGLTIEVYTQDKFVMDALAV